MNWCRWCNSRRGLQECGSITSTSYPNYSATHFPTIWFFCCPSSSSCHRLRRHTTFLSIASNISICKELNMVSSPLTAWWISIYCRSCSCCRIEELAAELWSQIGRNEVSGQEVRHHEDQRVQLPPFQGSRFGRRRRHRPDPAFLLQFHRGGFERSKRFRKESNFSFNMKPSICSKSWILKSCCSVRKCPFRCISLHSHQYWTKSTKT